MCSELRRSLPPEFVSRLEADGFGDVAEALACTAPVTAVRLNPRKGGVDLAFEGERVEWWPRGGVVLSARPQFTLDPALHQGRYYVQDPASMYFAPLVRLLAEGIDHPVALADLCAAPGGKTTAAIDGLPDSALVLANEIEPKRAAVLAENIAKWGAPSARIVTNESVDKLAALLPGGFDIVIADVPCSGEGMMRKEPKAVSQWSGGLVDKCAALQREIASEAWKMVAPGGYLIYSTCALSRQEDELNVKWLLEHTGGCGVATPGCGGMTPALEGVDGWRFMPGRTLSEGLFVAVIRKPLGGRPKPLFDERKQGMKNLRMGNATAAFPALWARAAEAVMAPKARIRLADIPGVALTEGPVPAQALALCADSGLRADAVEVEVGSDLALEYLRRQAIVLPEDAPKGLVLLTCGGYPLGWAKNLGGRANNLYPKTWRVRL